MNGSPICVDAGFLLRLLIPTETTPKAETLWARWHREGRELVAPTLLYCEVSNALHQYVVQGLASPSEVEVGCAPRAEPPGVLRVEVAIRDGSAEGGAG